MADQPALIVYSSLFPSSAQPTAGLFIRERMFRVGKHLPLVVVSPRPWFPGQGLIRRFRPHYRPMPPRQETQAGFEVYFPRFLALPGLFRNLDSLSMALASYRLMRRLKSRGHNLIDAHFAYPDGHAALKLGRWLGLPVTVTLRGTEMPQSQNPALVPKLREVFRDAHKIITVSDSLRQLALTLGLAEASCRAMPLVRRIPKRGFTNRFRVEYQVVNLRDLERVFGEGDTVSPELLVEKGLIRQGAQPVKILGSGELTKKLSVKAHKFSGSAQASIEKIGGSCEVVSL